MPKPISEPRSERQTAAFHEGLRPGPPLSDYEAFVCDAAGCGQRLAIPLGAEMTLAEWRFSPEVDKWINAHRQHAGCTGISLMPNARRRIERLDPDQIALTMIEDLSSIDDSEYWQAQPAARRKAARQVQLARLLTQLKDYLVGAPVHTRIIKR